MVNVEVDNRRKEIMSKLRMAHNRVEHYKCLDGLGIKLKIKRAILLRSKYLIYSLFKLRILNCLEFFTPTFFGKKIKIRLSDIDGMFIYRYGILVGSEYKLCQYLVNELDENDCFFDIGANCGFYTLLAQSLGAEVHAFEPNLEIYKFLEETFKKEGAKRVKLNCLALSDRAGELDFFDTSLVGISGLSTTVADAVKDFSNQLKPLRVSAITLDQYIKKSIPPSFIKIDVECAELTVINGGIETLTTNNGLTLSVEVHGGERGRKYSANVLERLCGWGYIPHYLNEEGQALRINFETAIAYLDLLGEGNWDNLIFKK
jgi:FkbM family methyltransferase